MSQLITTFELWISILSPLGPFSESTPLLGTKTCQSAESKTAKTRRKHFYKQSISEVKGTKEPIPPGSQIWILVKREISLHLDCQLRNRRKGGQGHYILPHGCTIANSSKSRSSPLTGQLMMSDSMGSRNDGETCFLMGTDADWHTAAVSNAFVGTWLTFLQVYT
jgi:hypothetical protein